MKRICLAMLAVILLSCVFSTTALAAKDEVGVAVYVGDVIVMTDAVKDEVYEGSPPISIGEEGDGAHGKAYFAYDSEYLYIFFEVVDSTVPAPAHGNITQSYFTDSAHIAINLYNEKTVTNIWAPKNVGSNNSFSAIYGVMRTDPKAEIVYEGGHAHLNNVMAYAEVVSDEQGYTAELAIPFGADHRGELFDIEMIVSEGISVTLELSDAPTGQESSSENEPYMNYYLSQASDTIRGNHEPYYSDKNTRMHKLEFEPMDEPVVTTPAVTTPVATTPAATTPAETTPAEVTSDVTVGEDPVSPEDEVLVDPDAPIAEEPNSTVAWAILALVALTLVVGGAARLIDKIKKLEK